MEIKTYCLELTQEELEELRLLIELPDWENEAFLTLYNKVKYALPMP